MKKIDIDKSLNRAINEAPLLNFEELVSMPFTKKTKHDYITRQEEKKNPTKLKRLSIAFSCVVLLICYSGWLFQYRIADSVITLDVNPSIKIVTNKQNLILSVRALNEDAQLIIDGQDYKNSELDKSIDTILATMINQGYIDLYKNTILVSVENTNIKKADNLVVALENSIRDNLLSHNISSQVLSQVISNDKDTSDLAKRYGVSEGKIKLIQGIIASNKTLSMEILAPMSMEELFTISNEYGIDLHNIIKFNENKDDKDIDNSKDKVKDDGESQLADNNNENDSRDDKISQFDYSINKAEQSKPEKIHQNEYDKQQHNDNDEENDVKDNHNNVNHKNDESDNSQVDENKNIQSDNDNEHKDKDTQLNDDEHIDKDTQLNNDDDRTNSDDNKGKAIDNENSQTDDKNDISKDNSSKIDNDIESDKDDSTNSNESDNKQSENISDGESISDDSSHIHEDSNIDKTSQADSNNDEDNYDEN